MANYSGLAQFLSTREDIDTQLVLSSSMKSADLSRVVDRFEIFRPQRLIFTKLDETASLRPDSERVGADGQTAVLLRHGQRIPEDLEAATKAGWRSSSWPEPALPGRLGGLENEPVGAKLYARLCGVDMTSDDERERLILQHLPQVRLIARRIQERLPENISLEDLISTGVLG
jgi:hypothetical protein